MKGLKNLERLDNAIEELNDLIKENNNINKDKANNIINEFNDVYIAIEDDMFSYMSKIEEMEDDLEFLQNKDEFYYDCHEEL